MTKLPNGSFFDEAEYLRLNPDVAAAVREGRWPSGYMHYSVAGRRDGRAYQPPIDEAWYLQRYPAASRDITAGLGTTPKDHYQTIGAFRGYLPNAEARPSSTALSWTWPFGGLWLDAGDAEDAIGARLELSHISDAEASHARRWARAGWLALRGSEPGGPEVDQLRGRILARAQLIHDGPAELKKIFSLNAGAVRSWLQASAVFAFASPARFLVLLEADHGEVRVDIAECGHRLAEPLHLGKFRSLAELELYGFGEALLPCREEYQTRLDAQIASAGLTVRCVALSQGESLLIHAAAPFRLATSDGASRLAVVSSPQNELLAYILDGLPV